MSGLNESQLETLALIRDFEIRRKPYTLRDLAEKRNASVGGIHKIVSQLTDAGYLAIGKREVIEEGPVLTAQAHVLLARGA